MELVIFSTMLLILFLKTKIGWKLMYKNSERLYNLFRKGNYDCLTLQIFLQGVPIFTKADPVTLSQVGKALTRYLLPPEIIFLHKGEVRRQMYIIAKGSVVMLKPDSPTGEAHSVFEATG